MVADDAGVDEAAEVQPLGSEMRHGGLIVAEMQVGDEPGLWLKMEVRRLSRLPRLEWLSEAD